MALFSWQGRQGHVALPFIDETTSQSPHACLHRYEMRDIVFIEPDWLTELAPHMYTSVPAVPR